MSLLGSTARAPTESALSLQRSPADVRIYPLLSPDLDGIDLEGFARALRALEAEAVASLGPEDLAHMLRLERWGSWCTTAGYATAWVMPNPLSMALLSTGSVARWAIVAHHTMHKGMDRVPGTPARLVLEVFRQAGQHLVVAGSAAPLAAAQLHLECGGL